MPFGEPRDEVERVARHTEFYGGPPPTQRLGLGPKGESLAGKVWDVLPALPGEMGLTTLPLPRFLARKVKGSGRRVNVEEVTGL